MPNTGLRETMKNPVEWLKTEGRGPKHQSGPSRDAGSKEMESFFILHPQSLAYNSAPKNIFYSACVCVCVYRCASIISHMGNVFTALHTDPHRTLESGCGVGEVSVS